MIPELNHGRWIVKCVCNSAERVEPGQADVVCRLLLGGCGRQHDLAWPDGWQEVERLVAERPEQNRNWKVGETLDRLRAENRLTSDAPPATSVPDTGNELIVVRGHIDPAYAQESLTTGYVLRYGEDDTTEVEGPRTEAAFARALKNHKRVG